jgi:nucleotide-binding universal stress UspA family protein
MNTAGTKETGMSAHTIASDDQSARRQRWPHVACLVDGSEASLRALPAAQRASGGGGRLTVLLVDRWASLALASSEWVADIEMLREGSQAWLDDELRRLGIVGAEATVLDGPGPAALRAWADRARPDLILAAERGGLARFLWGSVVAGLARRAPCPVLVISSDERSGAVTRSAGAMKGRRPRLGLGSVRLTGWRWIAAAAVGR